MGELPGGASEGNRPGREAHRRRSHEQRHVRAAVEARHEHLDRAGQIADPPGVGRGHAGRAGAEDQVALAGRREPGAEHDPLLHLHGTCEAGAPGSREGCCARGRGVHQEVVRVRDGIAGTVDRSLADAHLGDLRDGGRPSRQREGGGQEGDLVPLRPGRRTPGDGGGDVETAHPVKVDRPSDHVDLERRHAGEEDGGRPVDDDSAALGVEQRESLVGGGRAGGVDGRQGGRGGGGVVELVADAERVGPPQVDAVALDSPALGSGEQGAGVELERGRAGRCRHAGDVDPRRGGGGHVDAEALVGFVPEQVRVVLDQGAGRPSEGHGARGEAARGRPYEQGHVGSPVQGDHEALRPARQVAEPARVGLRQDRRSRADGEVALSRRAYPRANYKTFLGLDRVCGADAPRAGDGRGASRRSVGEEVVGVGDRVADALDRAVPDAHHGEGGDGRRRAREGEARGQEVGLAPLDARPGGQGDRGRDAEASRAREGDLAAGRGLDVEGVRPREARAAAVDDDPSPLGVVQDQHLVARCGAVGVGLGEGRRARRGDADPDRAADGDDGRSQDLTLDVDPDVADDVVGRQGKEFEGLLDPEEGPLLRPGLEAAYGVELDAARAALDDDGADEAPGADEVDVVLEARGWEGDRRVEDWLGAARPRR